MKHAKFDAMSITINSAAELDAIPNLHNPFTFLIAMRTSQQRRVLVRNVDVIL